ncbi:hypothetical protein LCGC14_1416530 [marine sediment metagenome]|uniref:Uncharacterized protein n=1 Tax=marine sediment metagenome TaxID=412755 RepID=A0A0F9MUE0_9ZZZZ
MKTRIRSIQISGYAPAYVIDEVVTKEGLYITWAGIHGSIESAKAAIKKEKERTNANN